MAKNVRFGGSDNEANLALAIPIEPIRTVRPSPYGHPGQGYGLWGPKVRTVRPRRYGQRGPVDTDSEAQNFGHWGPDRRDNLLNCNHNSYSNKELRLNIDKQQQVLLF